MLISSIYGNMLFSGNNIATAINAYIKNYKKILKDKTIITVRNSESNVKHYICCIEEILLWKIWNIQKFNRIYHIFRVELLDKVPDYLILENPDGGFKLLNIDEKYETKL